MIELRDGKSVFSLRACGILLRHECVLVQRAKSGFILPGGRVELLEMSTQTIAREMWEELGVHVKLGGRGITVERVFDYEKSHVHQVLFVYEMKTEETIDPERMESEGMRWWPVETLDSLALYPASVKSEIKEIYSKGKAESEK
ncbi:MAG: NUDIX domain-containing protein [Pirellulales bacterium]